jgi:hypothetical protein
MEQWDEDRHTDLAAERKKAKKLDSRNQVGEHKKKGSSG